MGHVMAKFRSLCIATSAFFLIVCPSGSSQAAMLSEAQTDASRLLPPPPMVGSALAKAEVAELHAIAARRTPEMLAAAIRDANDAKPDMFNGILGFDVMALPATAGLLDQVLAEEETDTKPAKAFFHRDRPWIVDPGIATCTKVAPGPAANSYPSGHASMAYSIGIVLAALMPQKAQIILARAAEASESRLVCGMHFRSDIVAGQQYGTVLALQLMQRPAFAAQMDAARTELRAAHRID